MATELPNETSLPNVGGQPTEERPEPPAGLKALIDHYQMIYPDQMNPLQVTTVLKYWLGGHDPLDYISMYNNRGDKDKGIAPHWHYISFGLSDLHGDGRVHERTIMSNENAVEMHPKSGMGFELSFRLLKSQREQWDERENPGKRLRPPTWPANLLQSIARYCFQTGNGLCVGDNIPWRKSLDGTSPSKIQNILLAEDLQLGSILTPFGTVEFCQIVGVTDEELEQASRWNGRGVLNFLRQDTQTGGDWLLTDMTRTCSVFELFPETLLSLKDDLEKQGSDLAGVNADFTFRELKNDEGKPVKNEMDSNSLSEQWYANDGSNRMQESFSKIKTEESTTNFPASMSQSSNSLHKSCPLDYQPPAPDCVRMDGIEVTLAPYAAKFLMLAIKDRIRHGRHFTFKAQHLALTLVAESVTGSMVSAAAPYGVLGYWIQVLIPDELVPRMMEALQAANLDGSSEPTERLVFDFPDKKFRLIVDEPSMSLMKPDPLVF